MVISTQEDYNNLLNRINREKCILTPIFRDIHYHRMENEVLCAAIAFRDETYILSVSHTDAPSYPLPSCELTDEDIKTLAYVHNKNIPEIKYSSYIQDTCHKFGNMEDVNKFIPLMSWSSVLKNYAAAQWAILDECALTNSFYTHKLFNKILKQVESSGLHVDRNQLLQHFGDKVSRSFKHDMVYTEYNLYTATGRPSNRFGGINFSALNKTDGSRNCFNSRYTNGTLVQLDFEAYHLRLLANEYKIKLPSGSLHAELAKIYFNADEITEEMYSASKQKTFEIMYGMSDETYGIELFKQVVHMRNTLKNTKDIIELPSGLIINMNELNANKALNYIVQSMEVVNILPKIQLILEYIKNTTNHLILYTYDSVLFDMETFDSSIIKNIVHILEEDGAFPVRIYKGTTYGNITEIRL